jgi:predicted acetyltransferase
MIHLIDARDAPGNTERRWIENVYPFYLHDLSEFSESIYHLNEGGIWEPDYLPVWFSAAGARPLVLRAGKQRIGFAFVGQEPFSYRSFDVDQRLSEFFILRSFRGRGLGRAAAISVLQAFPGVWELFTLRSNRPAQAFWEQVLETAGIACEPEAAVHSIRYRFQVDTD